MRHLIITICGSGGGRSGPNGCYLYLEHWLNCVPNKISVKFDVEILDTVPTDLKENKKNIIQIVENKKNSYEKIYLCGWSLGGRCIAQVATEINTRYGQNKISGLILLAPKISKIEEIDQLTIPLLFIHGTADRTIRSELSRAVFNKYQHNKTYIALEGSGHCFDNLTADVMSAQFVSYFIKFFGYYVKEENEYDLDY